METTNKSASDKVNSSVTSSRIASSFRSRPTYDKDTASILRLQLSSDKPSKQASPSVKMRPVDASWGQQEFNLLARMAEESAKKQSQSSSNANTAVKSNQKTVTDRVKELFSEFRSFFVFR